jgi:hypothetical protein
MSLAKLLRVTGVDDDTGQNVPEREETLRAQQRALLEGRQRAQMFPAGTSELELPEGMQRVETPRGVFHFDPRTTSADEIRRASEARRENKVLGLGPASKADVAERVRQGEPVAAMVETDPRGAEVKAALVTPSTVRDTREEMEARRAPESRVELQPVQKVVSARASARGGLAELMKTAGVEQEPAPPGTLQGIANTARRGIRQAGQTIDAASMAAGLNLAEDAAHEPERIAYERAHDRAPSRGNFERYGASAERVYKIAIQKWEAREAAREERLRNNARYVEAMRRDVLPALASAVGRRQGEIDAIPRSEAMQAWDKAETTGEALKALAANPVEVLVNLGVEGATSGAPSLALGAGGSLAGPLGTASGAGLGSFVSEYGAKIVEEMKSAGVDFTKPETVEALLRDTERMAAIREKAVRRGVPVAVLDALSAGIAGKLVGAPAKSLRQRVARSAVELGAQAGLGGAGEALGSVAAGEEVSGKAVLGEMLGEVGSGSAQIAIGTTRDKVFTERVARPDSMRPAEAQESFAEEAAAVDLLPPATLRKPKLGKPADALAAAIARRPDEDFKADLSTMEGRDVDLVGQLARYGETTIKTKEDFPAFAERMTKRFGDRVQAYLPHAWEAVNGDAAVKDMVPAENPLQIESGWKRSAKFGRLFWEGSADVLRRAGVHSLANAIDAHVDFADRNLAKAWGIVKPAVESFQGVRGLVNRGRAKYVFDEFEAFYRARENGRMEEAAQIASRMHPETRELVHAVQRMFAFTGAENRRLGVRVRDPRTGELRPIGYLGVDAFPRLLKDDVLEVLRDPTSDPQRWEEMKAQLVKHGTVQDRGEAGKLLAQAAPDKTSTDYFGSLEKARAARLPEDWYEYDFRKVVPRYVQSWSERAAQIEAYGQKIAETDRDAFDVTADATRNPETQRYIKAAQDHAYRVNRMDRAARRAIGNLTSATTALFLGNPYSTLRNLIGGTAQTVNQYGVTRAAGALHGTWRAVDDAEAAGALKADVADLLFQDDATPPMRKLANFALKASGFNLAESFVRAHAFLTAKTFLRDAVRSWKADPTSRRSLEAQAFVKRLGFDLDRLAAEKMDGEEVLRFLRKSVRDSQGGYRFDQVPLFTDGPLGRFLMQFARWGTQATRFHAEQVIKPAVFGTEIRVMVHGQPEVRRVRTLLPLLRSPFVAAAAGATTYALRKGLFGTDRPDATWEEVWKTLDEDERRGFELALDRMVNDMIMGGTFGALTDYTALLRDATERGRFKNPIEPPAASLLKETGILAYKLAQQGRLSTRDYREYVSRMVTAYRYNAAIAYRFANAVEADWAAAKRYQAEQDKRFTRSVGRRFGEEMGYDQPGVSGGLPRVSENTPTFADLEDALLSGEALRVRAVVAKHIASAKTEAERAHRFRQLRMSAIGRQPMRPGGQVGVDDQQAFTAWARRRLPAEDFRRIREIQWKWMETGRRGGLFTLEDVARYATQK